MLDTPQQQEVFRQILDLNWEISNKETELVAKKLQLEALKMKLQDLMGKANYNSFLELGRQMFEPAD
jgi:tRNA U38,U39,U40 pseudouridine synthase TruA